MNRSNLIIHLAAKLDITYADSKKYLEAFEDALGEILEKGEPIILQGFGSFSRWHQTGRPARNPKTGAPCMISPRNSVKFRPGKFLLERLNNNQSE